MALQEGTTNVPFVNFYVVGKFDVAKISDHLNRVHRSLSITCQIWTGYQISNQGFDNSEKQWNNGKKEIGLVTPSQVYNKNAQVETFANIIYDLWHDDVIKWKQFRRYWLLCGEFTGHRWIPHSKASDAELWYFLWSAPEQRWSKQPRHRWFETPRHSLWRHCNGMKTDSCESLAEQEHAPTYNTHRLFLIPESSSKQMCITIRIEYI